MCIDVLVEMGGMEEGEANSAAHLFTRGSKCVTVASWMHVLIIDCRGEDNIRPFRYDLETKVFEHRL